MIGKARASPAQRCLQDARLSRCPGLILAASDISATPVALLIGCGVLIALVGHLAGSRRTVVAGLGVLFVATALLLVGGYLAYQDDPGDPRPCDAPRGCAD